MKLNKLILAASVVLTIGISKVMADSGTNYGPGGRARFAWSTSGEDLGDGYYRHYLRVVSLVPRLDFYDVSCNNASGGWMHLVGIGARYTFHFDDNVEYATWVENVVGS